jgi:hypothetical protein
VILVVVVVVSGSGSSNTHLVSNFTTIAYIMTSKKLLTNSMEQSPS